MTLPTSAWVQDLIDHPQDADRLMRAACAELRAQPQPAAPGADALSAGLARLAPWFILHHAGQASRRRRPLSSNVRQHKRPHPYGPDL